MKNVSLSLSFCNFLLLISCLLISNFAFGEKIFEGNITAPAYWFESGYRGKRVFVDKYAKFKCASICSRKYGRLEGFSGYKIEYVAPTGEAEGGFDIHIWHCYCFVEQGESVAPAPKKSGCSETCAASNLDSTESVFDNYLAKSNNPKLKADLDKAKSFTPLALDDEATKVDKNKKRLELLAEIVGIKRGNEQKDTILKFILATEGDIATYSTSFSKKYGVSENDAKELIVELQKSLVGCNG